MPWRAHAQTGGKSYIIGDCPLRPVYLCGSADYYKRSDLTVTRFYQQDLTGLRRERICPKIKVSDGEKLVSLADSVQARREDTQWKRDIVGANAN